MTSRPLPWVAALLVAAAAVGGWLVWRATSGGESPDDVRLVVPAADPAAPEMDPRVRAAIQLLLDADAAPDPAVKTGKAKEAIAKVSEAERARAGDAATLALWRGIAAVMAGDEREARAALDRVISGSRGGRGDSRAYYLFAKVTLAFDPSKAETAVRMLRTLRTQAPQFMPEPVELALFDALRMLAAKHVNKRDPDGGAALLQEAIGLTKADLAKRIDARRELARAYGRAGRWMEARDEWGALLDLSEGRSLPDRFMVAVTHAAQNQWEQAIQHYSFVVKALDSGTVPEPAASVLREAILRRGNALRYLGKLAEAKADLDRYVREVPEDSRGHYWIGMYYLDGLDEAKEAIPHLERARALAPYCEEALRTLLMIYEVQVPDEAKVKALRAQIEGGREERKKERERLGSERTTESGLCQ